MDDRSYSSQPRSGDGTPGRFGRWLADRPAESWMFFVAGLLLGGMFL